MSAGGESLPPLRLGLDVKAEGSVGRLRLFAAVIAGLASVAILVGRRDTPAVVLGVLGLLASLGWVMAFRGARKRRGEAADYFLELGAEELVLATGATPRRVAYQDVLDAEVDEDRLVVALTLIGGGRMEIPPLFAGHGLYELETLIRERLGAAHDPGDG